MATKKKQTDAVTPAETAQEPTLQHVETVDAPEPEGEHEVQEGVLEEFPWLPCKVAYCTSVRVRANPGRMAETLLTIPVGTQVLVDPFGWVSDGVAAWFKVDTAGVVGYVMGRFLSPVSEA